MNESFCFTNASGKGVVRSKRVYRNAAVCQTVHPHGRINSEEQTYGLVKCNTTRFNVRVQYNTSHHNDTLSGITYTNLGTRRLKTTIHETITRNSGKQQRYTRQLQENSLAQFRTCVGLYLTRTKAFTIFNVADDASNCRAASQRPVFTIVVERGWSSSVVWNVCQCSNTAYFFFRSFQSVIIVL